MADTSNHILGDELRPCWHCDTPTRWLELAFEVPLCPGQCTDAKWAEFDKANWDQMPLLKRARYWWYSTVLHHIVVANGPLWRLCRGCRALRR